MKRVEIEIEGVATEAELKDAGAPRATAALWDALPIEAPLEHSIWSGRACELQLPSLSAVRELEHPCSIYPGTLVARPDGGEVLISYGAAEYRSVLGWNMARGLAGWCRTGMRSSTCWRECMMRATSGLPFVAPARPRAAPREGRWQ